MNTQPLIGDVSAIFKFGKPEDYAVALEAARLEQEQQVGYPLVVKGLRQTHFTEMRTPEGGGTPFSVDVYEVYATFAPAPVPTPEPVDGTKV